MKKSEINPLDLLKDLNIILENINLLENDNIKEEKLSKINKDIKTQTEKLKTKYKNLDTKK